MPHNGEIALGTSAAKKAEAHQWERLKRVLPHPPKVENTRQGVEQLMRWYHWQAPFHNAFLYAYGAKAPIAEQEARAVVLAGLGGTCHILAAGFRHIAEEAGIAARYVAARVGRHNDHLLVQVALADGVYLVDVGNNQPYLRAFSTIAPESWEVHGWHFSTAIEEGHLVLRRLHVPQDKPARRVRVYATDLLPIDYDEILPGLIRHHTESGFGPFGKSLRIMRIFPDHVITLRDNLLERFTPTQSEQRTLGVLALAPTQNLFALPKAVPIAAPLGIALPPFCPPPLGHGVIGIVSSATSPTHRARVRSLLDQLGNAPSDVLDQITIRFLNLSGIVYEELPSTISQQVADPLDKPSIARARTAMQQHLVQCTAERLPDWVWILDDDLDLPDASKTFWTHWTQSVIRARAGYATVLAGTVRGAPPIPVLATLLGHATDLDHFLNDPTSPPVMRPEDTEYLDSEAYYDHSVRRATRTTPACALPQSLSDQGIAAIAAAFATVAEGFPVSRPVPSAYQLSLRPDELIAQGQIDRCPNLGGHTLFLSWDSYVGRSWPEIVSEGGCARRTDTIGMLLRLYHGAPEMVGAFPISLGHHRDGQEPGGETKRAIAWQQHLWQETVGVVITQTLKSVVPGAQEVRLPDTFSDAFAAKWHDRQVLLQASADALEGVRWRLAKHASQADGTTANHVQRFLEALFDGHTATAGVAVAMRQSHHVPQLSKQILRLLHKAPHSTLVSHGKTTPIA